MAVKDTVAEWVLTTKEPFRASDAAVETGQNIVNVRTALSALKNDGIVEAVERGLYRYTGAEIDIQIKEPKPRKKKTDPMEVATHSLKNALDGVLYEISKNDERIDALRKEIDELTARSVLLAMESEKIKTAYDALAEG